MTAQAGTVPSWPAASLLNPKGLSYNTALATTTPSRSPKMTQPALAPAPSPASQIFQFTSPSDPLDSDATPAAEARSNGMRSLSDPSGSFGIGGMLERNFNLQDRTSVPEPKRRKIDTEDGLHKSKNSFRGKSSGILAHHLNGKETGDMTPSEAYPVKLVKVETVDLTVDLTKGAFSLDST